MNGSHAMAQLSWRWILVVGIGIALVAWPAPGWLALLTGAVLALGVTRVVPEALPKITTRLLQAGIVLLGAEINLRTVLATGARGALLTMAAIAVTLALAAGLARLLRVNRDTGVLLGVGTAICGGSAIAAAASVMKPNAADVSVALAVVFLLNAIGLVIFPVVGHAMSMDAVMFGRWAALAIHDTSSVVGAGLAYGPEALAIATTTKLARALWIVPITLALASLWPRWVKREGAEAKIHWPWFIVGFVAMAALFTALPVAQPVAATMGLVGRRLMLLALFAIGLSLSRKTLGAVGLRPLALGVALWLVSALVSYGLVQIS